jgi:hypothetical protein
MPYPALIGRLIANPDLLASGGKTIHSFSTGRLRQFAASGWRHCRSFEPGFRANSVASSHPDARPTVNVKAPRPIDRSRENRADNRTPFDQLNLICVGSQSFLKITPAPTAGCRLPASEYRLDATLTLLYAYWRSSINGRVSNSTSN